MELERKAYSILEKWKSKGGKTAMLIDGARRVGKSHLVREFGKRNYRSVLFLDFNEENDDVLDAFKKDMDDLDFFFNKLSVLKNINLYRRETLVVFDEIQLFPLARRRIKRLVADGRFDYIETGSLISISSNKEGILLPSEEERMELRPLDFEEFLWAMGNDTAMPFIRDCFERRVPLGEAPHHRMMNLLREYMMVGGMPQAVSDYADRRDMESMDQMKRSILTLYRNDIAKYAGSNRERVEAIFDGIPEQLSRKEKKYKLSSIDKDARSRSYEDAFMWLSDGMIISRCLNATDPSTGLSMSLDHTSQKCYMSDTGLLVTHTFSDDDFMDNELYKDIFAGRLGINEGMIMENLVAQMLRANGHKLFFYSRTRSKDEGGNTIGGSIEIDFLVRSGRKICPIEVKSSTHIQHASLDRFIEKFGKSMGQPYILYTKDLKEKDGILFLPLYMATCI